MLRSKEPAVETLTKLLTNLRSPNDSIESDVADSERTVVEDFGVLRREAQIGMGEQDALEGGDISEAPVRILISYTLKSWDTCSV